MEAAVFENAKVKDLIEREFVMITLMTDDKQELPSMIEQKINGKTLNFEHTAICGASYSNINSGQIPNRIMSCWTMREDCSPDHITTMRTCLNS